MGPGCRAQMMLTVLLVSIALVADARDLEDKKWIKASTSNFEIYSRTGKKDAVDMLRHLEALRAILLSFGGSGATAAFPTSIIAVSSSREFRQLGGDSDFAGYFRPGLRQNNIILRDASGMNEANIVLHEYVHFLTHNASSFTYPTWYTEGYADYLGATHVSSKNFELFTYSRGRLQSLRAYSWLPVEKILTSHNVRDLKDRERHLFYAQSWALVHFLSLGRDSSNTPDVREGLRKYAELRSQRTGEVEAFELAFELDAETLNKRLETYLNKEFVAKRGKLETFLPSFDPVIVKPDSTEVAVALGISAFAYGEIDEAKAFFTRAAKRNATSAEALAGLGRIAAIQDRYDEARAYFDKAVQVSPDNAAVLLDRAYFYARQASTSVDDADMIEYDRLAAEGFEAIAKLGPTSAEYDLRLGRHLAESQEDYESALRLIESAYRKLPASREVQMSLLQAYLSVRRYDDAIFTAKIIQAWGFEQAGLFDSMQELIDNLQAQPDTK